MVRRVLTGYHPLGRHDPLAARQAVSQQASTHRRDESEPRSPAHDAFKRRAGARSIYRRNGGQPNKMIPDAAVTTTQDSAGSGREDPRGQDDLLHPPLQSPRQPIKRTVGAPPRARAAVAYPTAAEDRPRPQRNGPRERDGGGEIGKYRDQNQGKPIPMHGTHPSLSREAPEGVRACHWPGDTGWQRRDGASDDTLPDAFNFQANKSPASLAGIQS